MQSCSALDTLCDAPYLRAMFPIHHLELADRGGFLLLQHCHKQPPELLAPSFQRKEISVLKRLG